MLSDSVFYALQTTYAWCEQILHTHNDL